MTRLISLRKGTSAFQRGLGAHMSAADARPNADIERRRGRAPGFTRRPARRGDPQRGDTGWPPGRTILFVVFTNMVAWTGLLALAALVL